MFPLEIIEIIASHNWHIWGRLMATCRDLNAFMSGPKAYKLFTRREIEYDNLQELIGPNGKTIYIGFRTYTWTTLDTQQEIRHVYYAPDSELSILKITYALSGFELTYRRKTGNRYTLEKAIKTNNMNKKIKLLPISGDEWDAAIAEYE